VQQIFCPLDNFSGNMHGLRVLLGSDRWSYARVTCEHRESGEPFCLSNDVRELLPSLFELKAGNFYIALAGETDRVRVLKIIREYMKPIPR
jgi:hypothetical protein